jgi:hypothetical protein
MSVLTLDWREQDDSLPYGWYKAAGAGQPTIDDTDGLSFTSAPCLVLLSKNRVNRLGTAGTTTISFEVGTTASSSVNGIGVVPYATAYPDQSVYAPWLNAVCNGTALMLSLGIKITADPGELTYQGGAIAYSGLTAGTTGTVISWWEDGGDGNGTITSILKYNTSWLGTLLTPVGTEYYLPDTDERPYVGHMGRVMGGEAFLSTLTAQYQVELSGAAPVSPPTLFYSGYYNNGDTLGNYNLSSMVISISPIQHSMYFPGYREAVFSPEVRVVLKNDGNAWDSFTGYASSGTTYQPPGLFYVRHPAIQGGDSTIFTGFCDYSNIEFDALAQTVTLKLQSVFGRLVNRQAVPASVIGANPGGGQRYGIYRPGLLGDVDSVLGNYGEEGTVVVTGVVEAVEAGDLIAADGGVEAVEIKEILESEYSSVTFIVAKRPGWLKGGVTLNANRARVANLNVARDWATAALLHPLQQISTDDYGGAPAPSWTLANVYSEPLEEVSISPGHKFSGNETLLELARELLAATGGGLGYDGDGLAVFTPSLAMLAGNASGTYDFSEVAVGERFKQSVEEPVSRIFYNYGWDDEDERFVMGLDLQNSTGSRGRDLTLSTKLVRLSEQAMETAAVLLVFWGAGGAVIEYGCDPDYWTDFAPGLIVDYTNLPTRFAVTNDRFIVLSRVFDPESQWMSVTVLEIPQGVSQYFRVDEDSIGGVTPVL